MRHVHPRKTSRGVVALRAAGVLFVGAALAMGPAAAPASAAPRQPAASASAPRVPADDAPITASAPASRTRAVFFQTRVWNEHDRVRSISVTVPGEAEPRCLDMIDLGNGYQMVGLDIPVDISRDTAYTVESFQYPSCLPTTNYSGSKGSVHPDRARKWTVYARYAPRMAR